MLTQNDLRRKRRNPGKSGELTIERIQELLDKHGTLRDVALKELGEHPGTLSMFISKRGWSAVTRCTIEPDGSSTPDNRRYTFPRRLESLSIEKLQEMLDKRWSLAAVAYIDLGVSPTSLGNYIKARGYRLRKRSVLIYTGHNEEDK
jgi:hypothetical protein